MLVHHPGTLVINVVESFVPPGTEKGRFVIVKDAEQKKAPLVANLGDLNRPVRVRPVRYMGREWWAIDADDTWPGMVMDLRRLGFESVASGEEVFVRESPYVPDPQLDGPNATNGLRPFPTINPTIRIRRESYISQYIDLDELENYDEEVIEDEDEIDNR